MRRILALLPCLLLVACVTTDITSQRLPGASNAQPFKSLFVFNAGMSLENTKLVEGVVANELTTMGVVSYPGTSHIAYDAPPADVAKAAASLQADGLLILIEKSSQYVTAYIPPTYEPGKTSTKVEDLGDSLRITTTTTPGTFTGGDTIYYPHGRFSAHLYDLRPAAGYRRIWLAEMFAHGNGYATLRDVFLDAGKEAVKKLKQDGLIVDASAKK